MPPSPLPPPTPTPAPTSTLPRSFIDSALPTRAEFEASLRLSPTERLALEHAAAAAAAARGATPPATAAAPSDAASAASPAASAAAPGTAPATPVRPAPVATPDGDAHVHAASPGWRTLAGLSTPLPMACRVASPLLHELSGIHGVRPFRFAPGGAPARPAPPAGAQRARIEALVRELITLVRLPPEQKNVGLLEAAGKLTRLLGGGRVVMCKSGKDRTSMGVTLEFGRVLAADHGLTDAHAAVQAMRRRGVRRENVRLNTGKRTFAFNWLQQTMLPEPYRPPKGSAKGGKG